jgi:peptidoglycan/LPS O-acetylase OafA/YrhL
MNDAPKISAGRRILELDGLRGVAVIFILIEHNYMLVPIISDWHGHRLLKRLLGGVASGVELFFVLSGFLIASILLENRLAKNVRSVFYTRRISRTGPVYLLLLGSFLAVKASGLFASPQMADVFRASVPFWSYAFMVQNIAMAVIRDIGPFWLAVTWSLAVEEQFYLLMPWLVKFMRIPVLLTLAGASLVICPLLRWMSEWDGPALALYLLPARMENLLLGVVLAVIWHREDWMARLAAHRAQIGVGLLAFIPLFFALPFFTPWWLLISVQGIGYFFLLIYVLLSPDSVLSRWLRSRSLLFMGGISYFVYLFHLPFLYFFHAIFRHDLPFHVGALGRFCTWASLVALVLAGACSRRWLELPFIRLGKKRRYQT